MTFKLTVEDLRTRILQAYFTEGDSDEEDDDNAYLCHNCGQVSMFCVKNGIPKICLTDKCLEEHIDLYNYLMGGKQEDEKNIESQSED